MSLNVEYFSGRKSDELNRIQSSLFVGRTAGAREVLRLDFFHVEFCRTLTHGLQYFFEWRRFTFNPPQGIDAGHDKGAQVRAHQSSFLEFFDRCRDFLFQVQYLRGAFLMLLERGAKRFVRKALKPPEN